MIILNTWHPLNGEWVHIVQTSEKGITKYFTNGKLVHENVNPK